MITYKHHRHAKHNIKHKLILIFETDSNSTNCVQTFHEPPSLRPRCSSLSAVGHPRAGTKLHRVGNPRLGKVNGKTHSYRGRIFSQEPLMPTAHRLSFPTCLSHPRSIHLHCHQDSPSAAKPPLPWASTIDWTRSLRAL
jgi:hypothetical protein